MKLEDKGLKIVIAIAAFVLFAYMIFSAFFSERSKRWFKDVDSEFNGGLDRTVSVYDYNGNMIKQYVGKVDIEPSDVSGKVKFDMDGKRTIIYGGIVIVDEQ